jgi:hypothetical protein
MQWQEAKKKGKNEIMNVFDLSVKSSYAFMSQN